MNLRLLVTICLICSAMLPACVTTQSNPYERDVTAIDFSPDGSLLAYANSRGIRVFDRESKQLVATLSELPPDPTDADQRLFRHGVGDTLVFLDDSRIASTGMGGLVSIWDARSGRRLAAIDPLPENEFASSIDYSPVTGQLVIGTSGGRILLAQIRGNEADRLDPLAKDMGYVWDLQFSRDGSYLASASQLPVDDQEEVASDISSEIGVPDGFAEATWDPISVPPNPPNITIWDVANRESLGALEEPRRVLRMALVPGEQALLTAGEQVEVWGFLTQEQVGEIEDPSMVLQSIGVGTMWVFSIAGMSMGGLPGVSFGEAFLATAPAIPTPAFVRHGCARAVAISPDARTIVSTTRGPSHNVMAAIDRETNQVTEKWAADSSVCDLQFSPDGRYLVGAASRGVFVFDTINWQKKKLGDL